MPRIATSPESNLEAFPQTSMTTAQKISPLTMEDSRWLTKLRGGLEALLESIKEDWNYRTVLGKLTFLHALLKRHIFGSKDTTELKAMGAIFGDAVSHAFGFEWVIVEDEHGRDPALHLPRTDVVLFPLSMISSRIEQGEDVDVAQLFAMIGAELDHMRLF